MTVIQIDIYLVIILLLVTGIFFFIKNKSKYFYSRNEKLSKWLISNANIIKRFNSIIYLFYKFIYYLALYFIIIFLYNFGSTLFLSNNWDSNFINIYTILKNIKSALISHLIVIDINYDNNIHYFLIIAIIIKIYYSQKNSRLTKEKEEWATFAKIMNHDLRNYLSKINSYADLMLLPTTNSNEHPLLINKIKQNLNSINLILSESIDLSNKGKIINKSNVVDLNEIVTETAEIVLLKTILFKKNTLPSVYCDKSKMLQVFKNLFENAMLHGKPSFIKVHFKPLTDSKGILQVINDGNIIPYNKRERILETAKNNLEEKGQGLIIIKKIILAHGWDIILEKDVKLTTFSIFINGIA